MIKVLMCSSLLLMVLPVSSQTAPVPLPTSARPGQTATGTLISESNGTLRLNASPCAPQPRIIVFRTPYVKDDAGLARCANGNTPMIQVSQS